MTQTNEEISWNIAEYKKKLFKSWHMA